MALLRAVLLSVLLVGCQALVNAHTKKFWPFDSWSTPANAKATSPKHPKHKAEVPVTTAAPAALHTAAPKVEEVKEAKPEKKPTLDDTEAMVMASAPFKQRLEGLCKDATAGDDLRKCQHVQGTRLWCAMFARNIQKFLYVDGMKEQRARCKKVNSMEGSDWFMQATWSLNFLQWGR
eukprot:TRINITY_DN91105_c0_g1_i1.p2 TRINITY_DN91105_c0_g1~~TRINITY_DN91105_c0_g1_i1.p2  ORF type:complete len:195 (-),score=45.39 TRINITY_DN91105_c0_g1_i1:221-751(-)